MSEFMTLFNRLVTIRRPKRQAVDILTHAEIKIRLSGLRRSFARAAKADRLTINEMYVSAGHLLDDIQELLCK